MPLTFKAPKVPREEQIRQREETGRKLNGFPISLLSLTRVAVDSMRSSCMEALVSHLGASAGRQDSGAKAAGRALEAIEALIRHSAEGEVRAVLERVKSESPLEPVREAAERALNPKKTALDFLSVHLKEMLQPQDRLFVAEDERGLLTGEEAELLKAISLADKSDPAAQQVLKGLAAHSCYETVIGAANAALK